MHMTEAGIYPCKWTGRPRETIHHSVVAEIRIDLSVSVTAHDYALHMRRKSFSDVRDERSTV